MLGIYVSASVDNKYSRGPPWNQVKPKQRHKILLSQWSLQPSVIYASILCKYLEFNKNKKVNAFQNDWRDSKYVYSSTIKNISLLHHVQLKLVKSARIWFLSLTLISQDPRLVLGTWKS